VPQDNHNTNTDIKLALEYFNNIQKKRSIAFLLSDFIAGDYTQALQLAARRHDLVGMHIYDKVERDLPNVGLLRVEDAETGTVKVIDTGSKQLREKHQQWFDDHEQQIKETFYRTGSDVLTLPTDEDYIKSLLGFFKRRSR